MKTQYASKTHFSNLPYIDFSSLKIYKNKKNRIIFLKMHVFMFVKKGSTLIHTIVQKSWRPPSLSKLTKYKIK